MSRSWGADLWTTEQKADKEAARASGVRVDVPHPPAWMRVSFLPVISATVLSWAVSTCHTVSLGVKPDRLTAHALNNGLWSCNLSTENKYDWCRGDVKGPVVEARQISGPEYVLSWQIVRPASDQ